MSSHGRAPETATVAVERVVLMTGLVLAIISGVTAYHAYGPYGHQPSARAHRIYDPKTGRLAVLIYDASGNGQFDTRAFMDGERVLRREVDENEDGLIDRASYFGDNDKIYKVAISSGRDGRFDVWQYRSPDGTVQRVEHVAAK